MTPALRAELRALGVTQDAFATITRISVGTASDWGRTPSRKREKQHTRPEPHWPWLLVEAWKSAPDALAKELCGLSEKDG